MLNNKQYVFKNYSLSRQLSLKRAAHQYSQDNVDKPDSSPSLYLMPLAKGSQKTISILISLLLDISVFTNTTIDELIATLWQNPAWLASMSIPAVIMGACAGVQQFIFISNKVRLNSFSSSLVNKMPSSRLLTPETKKILEEELANNDYSAHFLSSRKTISTVENIIRSSTRSLMSVSSFHKGGIQLSRASGRTIRAGAREFKPGFGNERSSRSHLVHPFTSFASHSLEAGESHDAIHRHLSTAYRTEKIIEGTKQSKKICGQLRGIWHQPSLVSLMIPPAFLGAGFTYFSGMLIFFWNIYPPLAILLGLIAMSFVGFKNVGAEHASCQQYLTGRPFEWSKYLSGVHRFVYKYPLFEASLSAYTSFNACYKGSQTLGAMIGIKADNLPWKALSYMLGTLLASQTFPAIRMLYEHYDMYKYRSRLKALTHSPVEARACEAANKNTKDSRQREADHRELKVVSTANEHQIINPLYRRIGFSLSKTQELSLNNFDNLEWKKNPLYRGNSSTAQEQTVSFDNEQQANYLMRAIKETLQSLNAENACAMLVSIRNLIEKPLRNPHYYQMLAVLSYGTRFASVANKLTELKLLSIGTDPSYLQWSLSITSWLTGGILGRQAFLAKHPSVVKANKRLRVEPSSDSSCHFFNCCSRRKKSIEIENDLPPISYP